MRYQFLELKSHINRINRELKEKEIQNCVLLNSETLLLVFENKKEKLVISLNKTDPLIYLSLTKDFKTSFSNTFLLRLKKLIAHAIIKNISLLGDDARIQIKLENEYQYSLIIELFPYKPNMYLCNADNKIFLSAYMYDEEVNKINDIYKITESNYLEGTLKIDDEVIKNHLKNELLIRRKEKYREVSQKLETIIKIKKRKILNLEEDIRLAKENLKYQEIAESLLTYASNKKAHLKEITIENQTYKLDEAKSVLENIESFFKKAKKAKKTLSLEENHIKIAEEEIKEANNRLEFIKTKNEKEIDEEIINWGYSQNKPQKMLTSANSPYLINYNGTIILFGKNKLQNDYLSFSLPLNREFVWLHIKDFSGAHIVIKNMNPSEKELLLASELALFNSHKSAGEVHYTKKKNVRRGHVLGEALIKNYKTIKINQIRDESELIFKSAKRLEVIK